MFVDDDGDRLRSATILWGITLGSADEGGVSDYLAVMKTAGDKEKKDGGKVGCLCSHFRLQIYWCKKLGEANITC